MANLTADGTTDWVTVTARECVMASASGTFGGGTLIVQVENADTGGTAIQVVFPSGVDGTSAYAIQIMNPSGVARRFRFSLSGSTTPDIDCFLE